MEKYLKIPNSFPVEFTKHIVFLLPLNNIMHISFNDLAKKIYVVYNDRTKTLARPLRCEVYFDPSGMGPIESVSDYESAKVILQREIVAALAGDGTITLSDLACRDLTNNAAT